MKDIIDKFSVTVDINILILIEMMRKRVLGNISDDLNDDDTRKARW